MSIIDRGSQTTVGILGDKELGVKRERIGRYFTNKTYRAHVFDEGEFVPDFSHQRGQRYSHFFTFGFFLFGKSDKRTWPQSN